MLCFDQLLLFLLAFQSVHSIPIGHIANRTLNLLNTTSTSFSGSLKQCKCQLLANSTYFGFNYHLINATCQFYQREDQDNMFFVTGDASSAFYFLSLPTGSVSSTLDMTTESESFTAMLTRQIHILDFSVHGACVAFQFQSYRNFGHVCVLGSEQRLIFTLFCAWPGSVVGIDFVLIARC
jgi:hypothetical protein